MTKKATLKELNVTMSRKEWSDDAGSLGVTVGIVLEVGDEDKDEVYAGAISWVSAKIDGTLKAHGRVPSPTEPPKKTAAPVAPSAPTAPTEDEDVFTAETITVEYTPGGDKRAKIKGGKWKKYGVMCWKEVLALPPLEWDLDTLGAADYPVPAGVQAIALLVDGKPKKIVGWK